jgi:hypothetical protein
VTLDYLAIHRTRQEKDAALIGAAYRSDLGLISDGAGRLLHEATDVG